MPKIKAAKCMKLHRSPRYQLVWLKFYCTGDCLDAPPSAVHLLSASQSFIGVQRANGHT